MTNNNQDAAAVEASRLAMHKRVGLFGKYHITKADGRPVDPGAEYFVLRLDDGGGDSIHVAACRQAVMTYVHHIASHLPKLAEDLRERYGRKVALTAHQEIAALRAKLAAAGRSAEQWKEISFERNRMADAAIAAKEKAERDAIIFRNAKQRSESALEKLMDTRDVQLARDLADMEIERDALQARLADAVSAIQEREAEGRKLAQECDQIEMERDAAQAEAAELKRRLDEAYKHDSMATKIAEGGDKRIARLAGLLRECRGVFKVQEREDARRYIDPVTELSRRIDAAIDGKVS